MSSLPGNVTITDYNCKEGGEVVATCEVNPCDNPFYAVEHPGECNLTVTLLRLDPSSQEIKKGRSGMVRVIAQFSNGAEADVTDEAIVTTDDSSIAEYASSGVVNGNEVGSTAAHGTWKGLSASGSITVTDAACLDAQSWDVVFVLDQSVGTYFVKHQAYIPRMGFKYLRVGGAAGEVRQYAQTALSFMLSMHLRSQFRPDIEARDRIAVVLTGDGHPYVHLSWSDSVQPIISTPMYGDNRLGEALNLAKALFASGRPEARKVCVVFTGGAETFCNPPYRSVAHQMKLEGIEVAIATPVGPGDGLFSACSYPATVYSSLQQAASPCLFFGGITWRNVASVMGSILSTACECEMDGYDEEGNWKDPNAPDPPDPPDDPDDPNDPSDDPDDPDDPTDDPPVYDPDNPGEYPPPIITCTGGEIYYVESAYPWGLLPNQNPADHIEPADLACYYTLFDKEVQNVIEGYQLSGYTVIKASGRKWVSITNPPNAIVNAAFRKVGHSCDPNDGQGDLPTVLMGNRTVLVQALCLIPPV